MIMNRTCSLGLESWLPAVQHEDRVECGCINRRRNAASQHNRTSGRIVGQADVGRKPNCYKDCGVSQHPRHAVTQTVVAAVVAEQRVGSRYFEAFLRVT